MKRETLRLQINYNKLLAYLGGGLVSFFTLFQITTEIEQSNWYLMVVIALIAFAGVVIFTISSFHNYGEIINSENKLGLYKEMKPSGIFSKKKNMNDPEREITFLIKIFGGVFVIVSFTMLVYILFKP